MLLILFDLFQAENRGTQKRSKVAWEGRKAVEHQKNERFLGGIERFFDLYLKNQLLMYTFHVQVLSVSDNYVVS